MHLFYLKILLWAGSYGSAARVIIISYSQVHLRAFIISYSQSQVHPSAAGSYSQVRLRAITTTQVPISLLAGST
jgi:hypothetical protein